jgi:SynChlorMet cassette protein ScmC
MSSPLDLLEPECRAGLPDTGWSRRRCGWGTYWTLAGPRAVVVEEGTDPAVCRRLEQVLRPVFVQGIARGGVLVHSALVSRGDEGVLLAGPSHIGKSTCSRRIAPPWRALSDDRALVVPTPSGECRVHPLPTLSALWEDSSLRWEFSRAPRLRALLYLEQADRDELVPISSGRSAVLLNRSADLFEFCCWHVKGSPESRAERERVFENVCRTSRTTPSFVLRTTLCGRFWDLLDSLVDGCEALCR